MRLISTTPKTIIGAGPCISAVCHPSLLDDVDSLMDVEDPDDPSNSPNPADGSDGVVPPSEVDMESPAVRLNKCVIIDYTLSPCNSKNARSAHRT